MKIKEDYVIVMLEDFFIRKRVDTGIIEECNKIIQENKNIACFNFELKYRDTKSKYINVAGYKFWEQLNNQIYLNSCQPSLWNKNTLIRQLEKDENAWEWEMRKVNSNQIFYLNDGKTIIDIGRYSDKGEPKPWFGIIRGNWIKEDVVPLFKKENVEVNYNKRGMVTFEKA